MSKKVRSSSLPININKDKKYFPASGIELKFPNFAACKITEREFKPTSIAILASLNVGPVEKIPMPFTKINLG